MAGAIFKNGIGVPKVDFDLAKGGFVVIGKAAVSSKPDAFNPEGLLNAKVVLTGVSDETVKWTIPVTDPETGQTLLDPSTGEPLTTEKTRPAENVLDGARAEFPPGSASSVLMAMIAVTKACHIQFHGWDGPPADWSYYAIAALPFDSVDAPPPTKTNKYVVTYRDPDWVQDMYREVDPWNFLLADTRN